jgi:hypothetical protein
VSFYFPVLSSAGELRRQSARIKADKARQLPGWSPTRGEGEFLEEIEDVVTAMFQQGEAE